MGDAYKDFIEKMMKGRPKHIATRDGCKKIWPETGFSTHHIDRRPGHWDRKIKDIRRR